MYTHTTQKQHLKKNHSRHSSRIARKVSRAEQTKEARERNLAAVQLKQALPDKVLPLQKTIGNQKAHRELQSGAIQAKLKIGHSGDKYEQEADRVADAVMRMPEQEEENILATDTISTDSIQSKGGSGKNSKVTQSVQHVVQSPGHGKPVEPNVRSRAESVLGANLGHVRVHQDNNTHEAAQSIQAKAFTHQNNIWLGKGQSPHDSGLMAHELTHVVQQGDAATVRRKILIAGNYYIPRRDYDWVREEYGEAMVEFLENMHNNGKPPEYKFKNYLQMHSEIRTRGRAIKGMEKTASACCAYPWSHFSGYLDSTYWKKLGPFHFVINSLLPNGEGPADAMEAIFKAGARTQLECNSMMTAVQYYGILKSIGPKRFNRRFPGGSGIVIKSVLVDLSSGIGPDESNTLKTERLYKREAISGLDDLLPGDWVFFMNVPDYSEEDKHPRGNWSGLHAIYLGDDKFSGFGLYGLKNYKIIEKLLEEYNTGLDPSMHKTIGDVPGIIPQVIRRPVVESYVK